MLSKLIKKKLCNRQFHRLIGKTLNISGKSRPVLYLNVTTVSKFSAVSPDKKGFLSIITGVPKKVNKLEKA